MDALALPARRLAGRSTSPAASGAASRSQAPALEQPDLLAARRADQPSRRRDRRLAAAPPGKPSRCVILVTHDRYFLDQVTGWTSTRSRPRHSLRGQLLVLARAEAQAPAAGRPRGGARQRTIAARAGVGAAPSPKARQAKSKARIQRTRTSSQRTARKGPTTAQIVIPIAGAAWPERHRGRRSSRRASATSSCSTGLSFKLPPGGIVGVSGRTAPARRRCSA